MKKIVALLTALLITAAIGAGIFVIGASALTNRNTVALQDAPAQAGTTLTSDSTVDTTTAAAQIQQLQAQVNAAQAQLEQANGQLQQYEQLIVALQQNGVIDISPDGRVTIPRFGDGDQD
jgi:peptidoglycan hydrolase CwlO-like protein